MEPMSDPYSKGLISTNPFFKKQVVEGSMVAVLANKYENREITLIPQPSRAVLKGEIHELMLTDEPVGPGDEVNRIFCLGFFEISVPGIVVRGDAVRISGRDIGTVAGFNDAHMPNHLNIVVHSEEQKTGAELEIDLYDCLIIKK